MRTRGRNRLPAHATSPIKKKKSGAALIKATAVSSVALVARRRPPVSTSRRGCGQKRAQLAARCHSPHRRLFYSILTGGPLLCSVLFRSVPFADRIMYARSQQKPFRPSVTAGQPISAETAVVSCPLPFLYSFILVCVSIVDTDPCHINYPYLLDFKLSV